MNFYDNFKPYDFPKFGFVRLPAITITDEERKYTNAPKDCTNVEFLKILSNAGFKTRLNDIDPSLKKEYVERGKRELALFEKLGFIDYILLVWKVTSHCDRSGIARDYGRGSVAGSLIAYLIGITNIEPIRYDLFFERFVSETRAKKKDIDGVTYVDGSLAPDVDIDIEQSKRGQVIEYVKSLYPNRVCKISTLATLSGKALIKECGKIVAACNEEEMKTVADLVPKRFGIVKDIEEAYKDVPAFRAWCDNHKEAYKIALKLRDIIKNKGCHPSGYVVSYDPVEEFLPLEVISSSEDSDIKEIATSLTMEFVSYLAIKLDLLGVRCCSVVSDVIKATGAVVNDINIDSDPIIYDNLQNLITPHGIFQLEAPTNLQVCQKIRPKNLGELSDVVAIARPGALSFLETYTANEGKSIHALFDPILSSSRFVCLYQEQMMQLSHAIGFTLDEAEMLRRIVGKKKREEIAVWEEKVNQKIKDNNLPPELGDLLWKILNDSASYSFNKSHAVSYAALAALTTYLKFKYPLEFYHALLKETKNEPSPIEEIAKIESELRYFGIKLLPPHLIKSDEDFKIEGRDIRFGLSSIKGVSEATIAKIIDFKNQYASKFQLFEGAKDAGLSIGIQAALIQSGCLDGTDEYNSRPRLTLEAQIWNILTDKEKKLALQFGEANGFDIRKVVKHLKTALDAKGKTYIKDSRYATIVKHAQPYLEIYKMNRDNSRMANFFYERNLLGYSYSARLIDVFGNEHDDLWTIQDVLSAEDGDKVRFVAVVFEKPYEGTSQTGKKNRYARWTLSDETGRLTGLVFNNEKYDKIAEVKRNHEGKIPAKDSIVYCVGKKNGDAVFLESISSQSVKIYTKFGELKRDREKNAVDNTANSQ